MFGLGAGDEDFPDFDFFVFIDVDVDEYAVVTGYVFALHYIDFAVFKSFFFEVLFNIMFGAVDNVGVDLHTGLQSDNFFAVLAFRLFYTAILDTRYAR